MVGNSYRSARCVSIRFFPHVSIAATGVFSFRLKENRFLERKMVRSRNRNDSRLKLFKT